VRVRLLWDRLRRGVKWMVAPVDALPQRVFEVACTLAFLVMVGFNFWEWRDWLTDHGYHLTAEEARLLGYPPPFPTMPVWMVPIFGVSLLIASGAVMLNRGRRLGLWVLFLGAVYVQGVDYLSTSAQNKQCIMVYALLATGPGLKWSEERQRVEVCRALPGVIMAMLLIVYWAAGYTKAYGEGAWLDHADSLRLAVAGFHRTELAAWALRMLPDGMWTAGQYGTLVFEIGAPFWFAWRRTRYWAIAAGFGLHLGIALMMRNVGLFSLQMVAFYPLFVSAEAWRGFGRWVLERVGIKEAGG
jgi:hypothetical protein